MEYIITIIFVIILFVAVIVKMIINNSKDNKKTKEWDKIMDDGREDKNQKLKEIKEKYNVDSLTNARRIFGSIDIKKSSECGSIYVVWVDEKMIHFIYDGPTNFFWETDLEVHIPIEDILYFKESGQIYRDTIISGGGGQVGGSSIPGAIIGGVIAGPAGAIIGSRTKSTIEPIKTEIKETDERYIEIKTKTFTLKIYTYTNGNELNLYTLRNLLPTKDYEQMIINQK